ncbi:hypothetical protein PUV44_13795 [Xanthomonas arboricola pv. corylina]|nr:hypothetical protein PUV44_13795 [Xanthomonas arboricola pv. corylina]
MTAPFALLARVAGSVQRFGRHERRHRIAGRKSFFQRIVLQGVLFSFSLRWSS